MNAIEKQRLVNTLGKTDLTYLDFQFLVKYISEAMQATEDKGFHWLNGIDRQISDSIQEAVKSVGGLAKKLNELETKISEELDASWNVVAGRYNDQYKQHQQRVRDMQAAIEQLPVLTFPNINLPYNWKEILDLADRLSEMPEEKRKHLVAFLQEVQPKPQTT